MKSPILDKVKDNIISNVFNERGKLAHKQRVRIRKIISSPALTTWLQRRLLSSRLSISYLNGLEPIMLENIRILDEVLASKCAENGTPVKVNIDNLMSSISTVSSTRSQKDFQFQLS